MRYNEVVFSPFNFNRQKQRNICKLTCYHIAEDLYHCGVQNYETIIVIAYCFVAFLIVLLQLI